MLTHEEARVRVAAGAAFLDRKMPGWAARIDITTLDLKDECHCIVAQTYTSTYSTGCRKAKLNIVSAPSPVDLGFYLCEQPSLMKRGSWDVLQDAWIAAIADRLHPDRPHDEELVESPAPSGDHNPVIVG
jgi:hypothetical protein